MNLFQRWVIDALLLSHKQSRHIERKLDILLRHLGADYSIEDASVKKTSEELAQATQDLAEAKSRIPNPPEQT